MESHRALPAGFSLAKPASQFNRRIRSCGPVAGRGLDLSRSSANILAAIGLARCAISHPHRRDAHARELLFKVGKVITILGYLVTTKNTSTKNHELMHFGTFYDSRGEVFDTVHFPIIAKKYPMRGRGFYLMRGKVTEDFGIAALEVEWMDKIPMINKRAETFMRETVS